MLSLSYYIFFSHSIILLRESVIVRYRVYLESKGLMRMHKLRRPTQLRLLRGNLEIEVGLLVSEVRRSLLLKRWIVIESVVCLRGNPVHHDGLAVAISRGGILAAPSGMMDLWVHLIIDIGFPGIKWVLHISSEEGIVGADCRMNRQLPWGASPQYDNFIHPT